jgi:TolB-like protein
MAGLYVVGAWLVVQVAETVLPAFDVPGWVLRAIIVLLAIGFLPALAFSWLFELTPDGVKRDVDVAPEQSIAPRTGRRMDRWMLAGIGAILLLIVAEWFWPSAQVEPFSLGTPSEASIAVLPFVNMSPDEENEFFADGIAEELLNVLVGVDGLKVASRTSAFLFKGTTTPVPEIARMLEVGHVLEGSVRKQGERVRITAQLIHAASDTRLWSEAYERDLTDIFRVQEDIARAITRALEDTLGVRRVSVAPPTADLSAYERFLRGRSRFYRRIELDEAINDLEFAVERDPSFADAWAYLAAAYHVTSAGWPSERDREALRARAPLAADRALALEADLAIALAVKGDSLFRSGEPARMMAGLDYLERAADLSAADTSARLWLGLSWLDLGFVDEALPHLLEAQRSDPMVPINQGYVGLARATLGDVAEGRRLALSAVELAGVPFWACVIAVELANSGDRVAAAEILAAAQTMVNEDDAAMLTRMRGALSDPAQEAAFLEEIAPGARAGDALPMLATLMFEAPELLFSNEGPEASYEFMTSSSWLPSTRWVREDPRFYALMLDRGIVGFWESYRYPPECRPVNEPGGMRLECSGGQR